MKTVLFLMLIMALCVGFKPEYEAQIFFNQVAIIIIPLFMLFVLKAFSPADRV